MKKIFTLLLVFTAILSSSIFAQCNPGFTFTVNGSNGNVQFTPANTVAVQHSWLFGDGTSSSVAAPSHTYVPGTYNVVHVVMYRFPNDSTMQCIDSLTRVITIVGQPTCNLNASFSFLRDSIQTNKVHFNNLSSGLTPNTVTYWNFGDGAVSFDANPVHIFATSGAYRVCLAVRRDSLCFSDTCAIVQVQVPNNVCNITVNYSSTVDSVRPNLIHFTNLSTPLSPTDSVTWIFGDGTVSHDINASHVFANGGPFNVCLVVKKVNSAGAVICVREFCSLITTGAVCNLVPGFAFSRDSTTTAFPAVYRFYNTSTALTNADSSFWNFGDGSPVIINPNNPLTHTYTTPGVYVVCLTVKKVQPGTINIICERQTCQTILIDTPQVQCNLQAYFYYVIDSAFYNKIYFNNQTTGVSSADSIRWTFGDGGSSTLVNPVHIYNTAGTYQVCLRVKKQQVAGAALCVDEYCHAVVIREQTPCNLQAYFADSVVNNTVNFINFSTAITSADSIRWTFGDGTSSTEIHPTHIYTQPGSYTVCLRVKKQQTPPAAPCVSEYCKVVVIQQTTCNLVADFTYVNNSINGGSPNVYHFTNTSAPLSNTDSSFWTFSDGTVTSYEPSTSFTHTFPGPGGYSVCLVVKSYIPGTTTLACVRQSCKVIIVSPNLCDELQVNFNWHVDSANNRKVYFINQSSPLTANTFTNWSFGDGDSSMNASPNHIYAAPGTYTVCLQMRIGNTCIKDTCAIVEILPSTVDSCTIHPVFITHIDSANRRKVYFSNTTAAAASAIQAAWNFGDGITSTGWNADHVFAMPGWYLVCLTVTSSNTCSVTHCDSVFVPGNVLPPVNCDSFHLEFGYRRDDYMPNKLFFFATGNAPVYSQQWTINAINDTSSVTLYQNNPVYVFPDTGYYRVCVRGYFSTNCYREFCDYIRINSTSIPSQCVVNAYPNPAHDNVSFNIQLEAPGPIVAAVYNTAGIAQLQYTQTGVTGNNLVTLHVQNLVTGFYTVRIMYNGRVCYTRFQKI